MVKPTKDGHRDNLDAFTVDLMWTWNRDLLSTSDRNSALVPGGVVRRPPGPQVIQRMVPNPVELFDNKEVARVSTVDTYP
jgi:hypothetical protein